MNTAFSYGLLSSRRMIRISGEDKSTFLQGLITNDVRKAAAGELVYACLLTPQGRFLHDFFIFEREQDLFLDCHAAHAEDLIKRLNLYKLRSKVALQLLAEDEITVAALFAGDFPELAPGMYQDPRLSALGLRLYGHTEILLAGKEMPYSAYNAHRLMLGVPEGYSDLHPEKSLLLDFGIDQLHGVDYQKGCYMGQEVTARMHYRANVKKAVYQVEASHGLPGQGSAIMLRAKEIGELCSHQDGHGIGLINIEVYESAAENDVFTCGGVALGVRIPDWRVL